MNVRIYHFADFYSDSDKRFLAGLYLIFIIIIIIIQFQLQRYLRSITFNKTNVNLDKSYTSVNKHSSNINIMYNVYYITNYESSNVIQVKKYICLSSLFKSLAEPFRLHFPMSYFFSSFVRKLFWGYGIYLEATELFKQIVHFIYTIQITQTSISISSMVSND